MQDILLPGLFHLDGSGGGERKPAGRCATTGRLADLLRGLAALPENLLCGRWFDVRSSTIPSESVPRRPCR